MELVTKRPSTREVVAVLRQRFSASQIARVLDISESAVHKHLRALRGEGKEDEKRS